METFDREMTNATVDLRNRLGVHIVRMMGPPMSPSQDRTPSAQTVRDAGTAANDLPIRDPRLRLELWGDRPGIFQLLLPRLESDREADTALAGAMWIAFVYGFLGWLSYFWQGRPDAGLLMFALFVVAGFGIRAGSRFAILCLFAFFAIACATCIACGGWALVPACLAVAPLMLAGGFRAGRYAASLDRPSMVTAAERASSPAKPFWTVLRLVPIILVGPFLCCAILTVLFGTIFNICSMDADGSMAPSIPRGDWIMGLTPPVMGTIHRGDIVAFSPEWYSMCTSRVVGLPGDRIQVKSGKLIRNGHYVDEPYRQVPYRISYGDFPSNSKDVPYDFRWRHESAYGASLKTDEPYVVPKEAYFVLNDDRNELLDSRVCGPVWQEYVYGKPVLAYNPSLRHWSLPRLIQ
jgi:signal peptidase I